MCWGGEGEPRDLWGLRAGWWQSPENREMVTGSPTGEQWEVSGGGSRGTQGAQGRGLPQAGETVPFSQEEAEAVKGGTCLRLLTATTSNGAEQSFSAVKACPLPP